jgi:hypothetical protein
MIQFTPPCGFARQAGPVALAGRLRHLAIGGTRSHSYASARCSVRRWRGGSPASALKAALLGLGLLRLVEQGRALALD